MTIPVSFKDASVKANRIHPQVFYAISVAAEVWEVYGASELVVTSLNDGNHRVGSLHYHGAAADLRTHNLSSISVRRNARDLLAGHLGREFDVIYESPGLANEHVHLEYQPKP